MSHMTSSKQHVIGLNSSSTKKSLSYENLAGLTRYVLNMYVLLDYHMKGISL